MNLLNEIYFYFQVIAQVVFVASLIAPLTKTTKDDELLGKIKPIVDALSLNRWSK